MTKGPEEGATHRIHGGNLESMAEETGLPADGILDFSSNLNPEGPPAWLPEAAREALGRIRRYPDPESRRAVAACSARFDIPPDHILFGNGADDLLMALPRAMGIRAVAILPPTYSGYRRAISASGIPLHAIPAREEDGFTLKPEILRPALARLPAPALVFLGRPNNPVGPPLAVEAVEETARSLSDHFFCVDESFVELAEGVEPVLSPGRRLPENLIVLRSLTKTLAVPGARVGYMVASPPVVRAARERMQSWPVNCLAEEIAVRAFSDTEFLAASAARIAEYRGRYFRRLSAIPGVRPEPGVANFLLLRIDSADARRVAAAALRKGVAFRTYHESEGLDRARWLRTAVRNDAENERAADVLEAALLEVRTEGS